MKTLENAIKASERLTCEQFKSHLLSETAKQYFSEMSDSNFENYVTSFEKLNIVVFDELAKALNEKNEALHMTLDCNYAKCKSKSDVVDVSVYSLLDKDDTRAIHFYAKHDKTNSIKFSVCCSCNSHVREKLFVIENDESASYTLTQDYINSKLLMKRDSNKRAKTIYRDNVSYNELVDLCKTILALLKD